MRLLLCRANRGDSKQKNPKKEKSTDRSSCGCRPQIPTYRVARASRTKTRMTKKRTKEEVVDHMAEAKRLLRESEIMTLRAQELSKSMVEEAGRIAAPLIAQVKDDAREDPDKELFQKPFDLIEMALDLDDENEEASEEMAKLMDVFDMESVVRPPPNHDDPYDVVVVGAGASGIGMGIMLTRTFDLDPQRVLILERGERVGESFRRWPKEMRFISPSFNNQGWTNSFDLNAIAYGTSPAYTLQTEHPTGDDYAHYLNELAVNAELNIQFNTSVTAIKPRRGCRGGFAIDVTPTKEEKDKKATTLKSRYVVWAAGEYQFAQGDTPLFPGSELCRHNSSIDSWKKLPGDDFIVIGGYESGMDALYNLTTCGKRCTVASSTAFWKVATDDPSTELAPYTMERVRQAFRTAPKPPRLLSPLRVFKVEKDKSSGKGGYLVHGLWGAPVKHEGGEHRHREKFFEDDFEELGKEGTEIQLHTPQPPLLCTGFAGSCSLGVAKDLFEWGEEGTGCLAGAPLVNDFDESTMTPGLFLVGPAVRHDTHIFCFVYKFRQRFAVVADAIARGLDFDTEQVVNECRGNNMFLDDFSCCKGACGETC